MKTITIAHQKGGVGKSTIALNLAYALIGKGYNVAIKDMDTQGTAFACAQDIQVYSPDENLISKDAGHDFLIIDTPPYLSAGNVNLFIQSDLVLIPTKASIADVLAIEKTIALVEEAQFKNKTLKARVVFNMVDSRTSMLEMLETEIEKFKIPIFNTKIEQRVTYTRTLLDPKGVFSESAPQAHKEMNYLADEVINTLK